MSLVIAEIFKVFAEAAASIDFACGPGCATCCTRSVTLTTAEGRLIVDFLRAAGRGLPELPRDPVPMRPAVTANGLAALCLAGEEVPEETDSPWLFEPCFFLKDGLCSIYPVRPFACRSFGSIVNCGQAAMAEVPEWFVTLAIVTNQLLEDLDRDGFWGNLADILALVDDGAGEAVRVAARESLLPNRPWPGLLVLPEERSMVDRFLARVRERTGVEFRAFGAD